MSTNHKIKGGDWWWYYTTIITFFEKKLAKQRLVFIIVGYLCILQSTKTWERNEKACHDSSAISVRKKILEFFCDLLYCFCVEPCWSLIITHEEIGLQNFPSLYQDAPSVNMGVKYRHFGSNLKHFDVENFEFSVHAKSFRGC